MCSDKRLRSDGTNGKRECGDSADPEHAGCEAKQSSSSIASGGIGSDAAMSRRRVSVRSARGSSSLRRAGLHILLT
jgi:hypothetical protein